MTPLRQRMTEDMQLRNLSPDTQRSYLHQISQLARYFKKSPDRLGPPEIRTYQLHLIQEKELAPSSLLVAVSAIRFLYNVTLQRDWRLEQVVPTCRKPRALPVVMSPDEVQRVSRCRREPETPDDPDRLLCGRSANLRGR